MKNSCPSGKNLEFVMQISGRKEFILPWGAKEDLPGQRSLEWIFKKSEGSARQKGSKHLRAKRRTKGAKNHTHGRGWKPDGEVDIEDP